MSDAQTCLLYTSDAADEEDSVDLGGRRIIKKKTLFHSPVGLFFLEEAISYMKPHLLPLSRNFIEQIIGSWSY